MRNANLSQLFLVVILLAIPCCLFAQQANVDKAKAEYEKGKVLYIEGNYTEAAESFRSAYELNPAWRLFYNIAQSEAAAKRYGLALLAFERYVADGGDEIDQKRQEQVMNELKRLREMVGVVVVKGNDGDGVFINNVDRGNLPRAKRSKVGMGVVLVEIRRAGKVIISRELDLSGGDELLIELPGESNVIASEDAVEAEPEPEPEPESDLPMDTLPAVNEQAKPSVLKTVGWVGVAVGGGMLIGGAITGGVALSKNSEVEDKCLERECLPQYHDLSNSRDKMATASTVLFVAGGLVAATGIVMLIVSGRKARGESPVAVIPNPTGITITGRF